MTGSTFTMDDLKAAETLVAQWKRQPGHFGVAVAADALGFRLPGTIAGVQIITSAFLTETVQHSRSPSRARRRAARGHRQHHREIPATNAYRLPDGSLVMHPARYAEIKARIDGEVAELVARR